jgi:uncharacterized protein (TIGR00106 family)
MHAVAELSLFPLDKGSSLSPYVARAVAIIRDSGLAFELGPMGTCIEGPLAQVMAVVQACAEDLSRDCDRVYLTVKADLSRKGPGRLAAKVRSVEEKLAPAR